MVEPIANGVPRNSLHQHASVAACHAALHFSTWGTETVLYTKGLLRSDYVIVSFDEAEGGNHEETA